MPTGSTTRTSSPRSRRATRPAEDVADSAWRPSAAAMGVAPLPQGAAVTLRRTDAVIDWISQAIGDPEIEALPDDALLAPVTRPWRPICKTS